MESEQEQSIHVHKHVPALDGVRGFAAASVFIYHYGGGARSSFWPLRVIGTINHFGWAGVSLFFALSGFLISGILWDGYDRSNWWRRFYARRSLRIFPLYYLAILIAATAWLIMGVSAGAFSALGYYALYLDNFPPLAPILNHMPNSVPLGHFWSLAVEEQFYVIWPFILAPFAGKRKNAMLLIIGLWIGSLAFRIGVMILHAQFAWTTEFLLSRGGELLAGACLAMMVRGNDEECRRLFRSLPTVAVGSLAILIGVGFLSGGATIETPLMATAGLAACSIFFASIVGLSIRQGAVRTFFMLPILRWLGKISYGIYVYHILLRTSFTWIVDHAAPGVSYNTHLLLVLVVAAIGTLGVASLSFYKFEYPFLGLKDRLAN